MGEDGGGISTTSAGLDDHVVVVFQDDFIVLVDVEHGDGRELGGDAAGAGHGAGVDRIDQRLDDGVIGRIQMIGQGEGAVSVAVVGVVSGWRHDPVVPAHVAEVDVEGLPAAVIPAPLPLVLPLGGSLAPLPALPVVRVGDQDGLFRCRAPPLPLEPEVLGFGRRVGVDVADFDVEAVISCRRFLPALQGRKHVECFPSVRPDVHCAAVQEAQDGFRPPGCRSHDIVHQHLLLPPLLPPAAAAAAVVVAAVVVAAVVAAVVAVVAATVAAAAVVVVVAVVAVTAASAGSASLFILASALFRFGGAE